MRFYDKYTYIKNLNKYNSNLESMKSMHNEKCNHKELRNIKLFNKWCEIEDIEGYFNIADIKLLNNFNKPNKIEFESIPFQDHAELFKKKNNERIFIIQPYKDKVEINKLKEWAKYKGLKIKTYNNLSWHLTGETMLIQFEIEDKKIIKV